eukprot:8297437-Heterocapsa_arctica.AAC.1
MKTCGAGRGVSQEPKRWEKKTGAGHHMCPRLAVRSYQYRCPDKRMQIQRREYLLGKISFQNTK